MALVFPENIPMVCLYIVEYRDELAVSTFIVVIEKLRNVCIFVAVSTEPSTVSLSMGQK